MLGVGWALSLRRLTRLGLLAVLSSQPAWANGRFPRAQRLVQDPARPEIMALYGTYGLLISDDGRSWQHVCEAATGPFSGEAPLLELLPGARLVLSSETGLRSSVGSACDWQALLEPALPSSVSDITRDPSDGDALWALISEPDVELGYQTALQRSADAGATWTASQRVPLEVVAQGITLDVPTARASSVYVSGLDRAKQGVFARSDDAGETWAAWPLAGTSSDATPYLAAIDSSDADRIFVRTDALKDHEGQLQPDDALLFSNDGGQSFARVHARRAKLLGFALSPDGQTVLAGYGDPVLYAYTVEPEQTGLYRARLADLLADPSGADDHFEKIFAGSVTCLRWTDAGLYACLAQAEQGFELGRADDAEFSLAAAQPFAKLLDLREVRPAACPASSSAGPCSSDQNLGWPSVCTKLGADCAASAENEPEGPNGEAVRTDDAGSSCRVGWAAADATERRGLFALLLGLGALWRIRSRARSRPDRS